MSFEAQWENDSHVSSHTFLYFKIKFNVLILSNVLMLTVKDWLVLLEIIL